MSRNMKSKIAGIIMVMILSMLYFTNLYEQEVKKVCGFNDYAEEATIIVDDRDYIEIKIVIDDEDIKYIEATKNKIIPLIYEDCTVEKLISINEKGKTYMLLNEGGMQQGITIGDVMLDDNDYILNQKKLSDKNGSIITYWIGIEGFDIDSVEIK